MWFPFREQTSPQLSRIKVLAIHEAFPILTFALQKRWSLACEGNLSIHLYLLCFQSGLAASQLNVFFCNVNFHISMTVSPMTKIPKWEL